MNNLTKADREGIVSRVITTVETKHFDPKFPREQWRSEVERIRGSLIDGATTSQFESALSDLVREYGAKAVGLLTGDNSINGDAPIVVMTT